MACSVFKMRFERAVHPLRRTIGGRLPFKPATKKKNKQIKQNKHKTRKPMPRKKKLATLRRNNFYLAKIKDLKKIIASQEKNTKNRIEHTNFYLAKVKHLEKTIAEQKFMTEYRIECYQDRVARDWDKIKKLERTKHKLLRMRNAAVIEHRWDCRLIDHLHETLGVLRAVLLAEGFAVDVVKGLNGALAQ